jgi:hypothetical protein
VHPDALTVLTTTGILLGMGGGVVAALRAGSEHREAPRRGHDRPADLLPS